MPRISKAAREAQEAERASRAAANAGLDDEDGAGGAGSLTPAQAAAALELGGWTPSVAVSDVSTSGDEDAGDDGGDGGEGAEAAGNATANGSAAAAATNTTTTSGARDNANSKGNNRRSSLEAPSSSSDSDDSSSDEDRDEDARTAAGGGSGSAAGPAGTSSSSSSRGKKEAVCRWEGCGEPFVDLTRFVDHLHNDHVGNARTKYACEWTGCSRRGKPQTSRFALLSHLRSHTGEKPFTCPKSECDKSFTRSDALSKHMRIQHDILPAVSRGGRPPAGGRDAGGSQGSGAAPTRTSGRRSVTAAAAKATADSLDEELLSLAGGASNSAGVDDDLYEAPGDLTDWDRPYLSRLPTKSHSDAQLGIEGYASVTQRLGIAPDEHALPGGPQSSSAMQVTLQLARRRWAHDMKQLQEAEIAEEGASRGAFLTNAQRQERARARAKVPRARIEYASDEDDDDEGGGGGGGDTQRATASAANGTTAHPSPSPRPHAALHQACLIETAKLEYATSENARLCAELQHLVEVERVERNEKNRILEEVLQAEIGNDISAIFTPVSMQVAGNEGN